MRCTASVSPAWTLVSPCGDLIEWKMERATRGGVRDNDLDAAMNAARARADHSHSRFCRKSNGDGNVSLLSVVSTWKMRTPLSASSRPMRQFEECSAEWSWSMNERLCCMVWTLWWWRRLRYDASPVATLLCP